MTVSGASLDESGSNLSKIAATSLLLGVTRDSSEAYDTADGEIILDEIIVFHTILYAPRHKRLVLLLECRRVIVDGEVEVVHEN